MNDHNNITEAVNRAPEHEVLDFGDDLVVRINADGTRLWMHWPGDGTERYVLGTHPEMSPFAARARRAALRASFDALARPSDRTPASVAAAAAAPTLSPNSATIGERLDAARRAFLRGALAITGAAALPTYAASGPNGDTEPNPTSEAEGISEPADVAASATAPFRGRVKAWIQSPKTFGASSYVRYSPINVVRGTIEVELRSTVTLNSVAITVQGPGGELLRSPVMGAAPYLWSLDTRRLPEGNVVIDADVDPPVPFLHAVVVIDNDMRPVEGEQSVPVGARNTLDEFTGTAWGYEWVRYPASTRGTRLPVRPAIPFDNRVSRHDLWQQAMTSTSVTRHNPSRQFTTLEGGHISVVERQPYTQADNFTLRIANCIDGPHGVGRVGSIWNGYVDSQGRLVAITGQGRGVRIDLEGRVETLIGPRLRAGVAAPMLLPSSTPTQVAWLESFYEHVGAIVDGAPALDNPWQMVADPHDEDVLYIADSDNNRVVVYDVRTRIGRTLAGGSEGFADGVGAAARFNRPRGLAWSLDGETLFVADDHNSAIRTLTRQGAVRTLVHSARGASFDLVLAERDYRKMSDYAAMIRSHMHDGAFGQASFMHPNALALDSEGNLIAACHHPHVVVKFDLRAGSVQTLTELPVGVLQIHRLRLAWISLSVDRWGAFGPKDQFTVAYWMQQSFRLYEKDGTPTGYYVGRQIQ